MSATSESPEILKEYIKELQNEIGKVWRERFLLAQKVTELQNEIFKLREELKSLD